MLNRRTKENCCLIVLSERIGRAPTAKIKKIQQALLKLRHNMYIRTDYDTDQLIEFYFQTKWFSARAPFKKKTEKFVIFFPCMESSYKFTRMLSCDTEWLSILLGPVEEF